MENYNTLTLGAIVFDLYMCLQRSTCTVQLHYIVISVAVDAKIALLTLNSYEPRKL